MSKLLIIALLATNLLWYRAYHKKDLEEMQASALLDWSNELLRDMQDHGQRLADVR